MQNEKVTQSLQNKITPSPDGSDDVMAPILTFLWVHIELLSSYAHLFGLTALLALVLPVEGLQLGHHLAEFIFELLKQRGIQVRDMGVVASTYPFQCYRQFRGVSSCQRGRYLGTVALFKITKLIIKGLKI